MQAAAEALREGKKVILVHANADMDALGSAFALAGLFPPADIYAPGGLDRTAKNAAEKLGIEILSSCDLSRYDTVAAVDTSSLSQLDLDEELPQGTVVIDHHIVTGDWDGCVSLIDPGRVSCCEIVYDLYRQSGKPIGRREGLMLMGGMISDSRNLRVADSRLLSALASLMEECGIPMDEAMDIAVLPASISERHASVSAVGRSRCERIGDMIVASALAGSFEASVCKSLLAAGADVSFSASQREEEFRISARATPEAVRRGVNLGIIMKGIGSETSSSGGGHDGAAGMSGTGDAEAMLHICMSRTCEVFREIRNGTKPKE